MSDPRQLTVLTTLGIPAVKTLTKRKNGSFHAKGYGSAKKFRNRPIIVDDQGRCFRKLAKRPNSFVVLGQPDNWPPGKKRRRLSSARDGEAATLIDVPRLWLPIDVDQLDFTPIADIQDGETFALEVANRLRIRRTHCVWHLTGSHGIEGRYRIRLWVKLVKALTCEQMKAMAKERWDGLVDMAVYRPAQPIYTGDPIFVGFNDPIEQRVGFFYGAAFDVGTIAKRKEKRSEIDDENVALLTEHGFYIRPVRPGQHEIKCPWEAQHTDGVERDDDTFYFEPYYNGYDRPGFKCHHGHCGDRRWDDVLDFLGVRITKSSFAKITDTESDDELELITIRASDVEPESIEWFWDERFALGKLSMIAGNPNGGKSTVTIDIAARVTTGSLWPVANEGHAIKGSVVMLSAEDSPADTIVPRLMAAGADLSKVYLVDSVKAKSQNERGFDLTKDLARLDLKLEKISDVKLVVIDPITSYGGSTKMDWNSTGHVRSFLKPLAELANRHWVAIMTVAHLNKKQSAGAAQMAVSGSVGQVAAARSVVIVVNDARDEHRKLFLPAKNNLAPPKQGLAYRLVTKFVGVKKIKTSQVVWEQEYVDITADEALSEGSNRRHTRDEAADWLRGYLANGKKPSAEVRDAATKAGYSKSTLDRVKDEIGIDPKRSGFGDQGEWTWELPKRKSIDEDVI